MPQARKSRVAITYNDISADQMAEYLSSFIFTDVASGSSDSISIDLNDRDRRWIGSWFPKKGDRLNPEIILENWDKDGKTVKWKCGSFVVDDFSFGGGPIHCSIEGIALPSTSGFKVTERTNTYEMTTLKEIGETVAKRSGMQLWYEAPTISVESVGQDKKTDCSFFSELVERYGLALKIYSNRLVVFDEAAYERKPVVATITEADFEPGWTWNTKMDGTYTGVKYQYTHPDKNKTFSVNVGGSGGRILICDDAANNQTEATLIALAKLNNANKGTTTMEITMRTPAWNIIASDCIQINGLEKLSGKYYVEKAVTSIASGTKTTLSLRLVEKRFTASEPAEPVRLSSSTEEAVNAENRRSK